MSPLRRGRLLDLACGHGKFSILARDLGWDVTGVDVRTERFPDAEGIKWVQSDVRHYEPEGFDCIAVLGLFYHLEIDDQLALLKRTAGTPTILDTHTSTRPDRNEKGYEGHLFKEVSGDDERSLAATPTASWGNQFSFWPTHEALLTMLRDCGYRSVYVHEPWYEEDRTFYYCL